MRLVRTFFFIVLLSSAFAAETGSISGVVSDPSGAVIPGAKVSYTNLASNFRKRTETDAKGRYRFTNLPLGRFTVDIDAPGFARADHAGELRGTTFVLDVRFKSVTEAQQITVTGGDRRDIARTSYLLEPEDLERTPQAPPSRGASAVLESLPSVVPEENGRIHVRGSETQPQYVLDGVPISDAVGGTFTTGVDLENVETTQVITGNIPAEFGDKTAAIVNLNSKSGLEHPWRGAVALSAGSFDSGSADVEAGGQIKSVGIFLTADGSLSHRFLDPPEMENFHNAGNVSHDFSRFDWRASKDDVVRLSLGADATNFQVPNLAEQQAEGQSQHQQLRDDSQALNWSHVFNPSTISDVTLFRRSSGATLLDPDVTGMPFFIEQHRRQRNEGMRANLSKQWRSHSIKVGAGIYRTVLQERFTLAVTDPEDVEEDAPIQAFTPEQPFQFAQNRTGHRAEAYVQDQFRVAGDLTADLGIRWDHYDLLFHDSAFSPRVGLAYNFARTKTIVRASYDRLFQTPPLENLLLSSSPALAALSANGDGFSVVPPERQNAYEIGVQQQIGKYLRLDVARYIKNVRNFSDDQQLFTTAIVFPVAIRSADVRGTEVRLDLKPVRGWSAYASYANAKATGTGPLVGGLLLGAEEQALLGEGEKFHADQDERNEVQWSVTYNHRRSGAWANLMGRYDSGIPTDFEAGDFAGFDPQIQRQLDAVRVRIKPRNLLNAAVGVELRKETRTPISLQLSLNNLTDAFYLYNFQSAFSGTHIGRPREVVGRIAFHWKAR